MFTEGLRHILAPHVDVIGTAQDGKEVVAAAERLRPDVIVMDISMPALNGIRAARKLRELGTSSKIVFCTMHDESAFVREALDAGATGYVLKSDGGMTVVDAIRCVLSGDIYLSSQVDVRAAGPKEDR
jgi:DNA-binding NarL/FixJ family response regulator